MGRVAVSAVGLLGKWVIRVRRMWLWREVKMMVNREDFRATLLTMLGDDKMVVGQKEKEEMSHADNESSSEDDPLSESEWDLYA